MNNTLLPYDRYLQLKEKFDYRYKAYNLKQLIPGYLDFVFNNYIPSIRNIAKAFHHSRKYPDIRQVLDRQSPTVITYLIRRTDYRNLALAAQSYYTGAEVVDLPDLPELKKSFFSIPYIYRLLKAFFIVFTRRTGQPLKTKFYLTAILTRILNQIALLENCRFSGNIQRYVCFNSAYREESILTAYFNNHGVETITLQHGIFCKFKLLIPFDYINFDNFIAQKMLCWGQSTIDYLTANGIDKDRLILMGNLKYKGLEIDKIHQTFERCLVLLGRSLYLKTNDKLLETLAAYNKQHGGKIVFYIKKHPFLLDEDHKQFAGISNNIIFLGREHSTEEVLKSSLVDFSIAVNTTAYYESLALGKPCLRWTEAENEEFYGMDDKFASVKELDAKITALKAMDASSIKTEMKNVIRYIFNVEE